MIKVYLDWGVMAEMKRGNQSELSDILLNNDRFFIPYSSSHIADIIPSYRDTEKQKSYIESDLNFISELTRNVCLSTANEEVNMEFSSPHDYFEWQLESKDSFMDLSMDGLINSIGENEAGAELMKTAFDAIRAIPLDDVFSKAFEHPESAELMNKLFPGLKDNPTMEGFFECFSKMNYNLMESDGYDDFRKSLQKGLGINRDQIFNSKDPYKIIDAAYEKTGSRPLQFVPDSKVTPKWYHNISNEFFILDSHGYQEDKVNIKKGRKQTFRNPTEDSNHAAYASMCNIYIVKDDKSYNKAKRVYEKLGIYTRVLKPDEFVDYYTRCLEVKNEGDYFMMPYSIIKSEEFYEQDYGNALYKIFYTPFLFLDYFNVVMIQYPKNSEHSTIILVQNIPNNSITYLMEYHHVYNKLCALFGEDIHKLGQIKNEEFQEDEWVGRNWQLKNQIMRLHTHEGNLQLIYNYKA